MRIFGGKAGLSVVAVVAGLAPALAGHQAFAADGDFLSSLKGNWKGDGMVLTKIGGKSVPINCTFDMSGGAASIDMSGDCRSMLVIRRAIKADLKASGNRYTGTYVGPSGMPSQLSGSQSGNAINLNVHWAKLTNGDRSGTMRIEKISDNRMRLSTIDKDLGTGKSVVTSRIDLSR